MGARTAAPSGESEKRRLSGDTRATSPSAAKRGASITSPVGARAVLRAARGSGSTGSGAPGRAAGNPGGAGGAGSGLPWKSTDPTAKCPSAPAPSPVRCVASQRTSPRTMSPSSSRS